MRRLIRDSVPVVIEILIGAGVFALPVSKAAAETCFVTALVCWLLNKIISRSLPATDPKIALLYGVFFGFSLASLAWIQPRFLSEGIQGIFKWAKYLGVFFMCLETYASPKKQLRLFWVFIASLLSFPLTGSISFTAARTSFSGGPLTPAGSSG